jgi:hypothetical protein
MRLVVQGLTPVEDAIFRCAPSLYGAAATAASWVLTLP